MRQSTQRTLLVAYAKLQAISCKLRECGVMVAESPADLGSTMAKALGMSTVAA